MSFSFSKVLQIVVIFSLLIIAFLPTLFLPPTDYRNGLQGINIPLVDFFQPKEYKSLFSIIG
jgi:hypothetical protein